MQPQQPTRPAATNHNQSTTGGRATFNAERYSIASPSDTRFQVPEFIAQIGGLGNFSMAGRNPGVADSYVVPNVTYGGYEENATYQPFNPQLALDLVFGTSTSPTTTTTTTSPGYRNMFYEFFIFPNGPAFRCTPSLPPSFPPPF